MTRDFVFDKRYAVESVEARKEGVRPLLEELRSKLGMRTAADIGCGVGYFSAFLREMGFEVAGFDGRGENVSEAKRRHPNISFQQCNVEAPAILHHGPFDLLFCFGLIYHLENPLLAIRHFRALTRKGLLIESMCFPDGKPWMLLRDEPPAEDQSLSNAGFYPSEGCLVKMLYRAGFPAVYRLAVLPDHDDFRDTREHLRRRTVLFASLHRVNLPELIPFPDPQETAEPWQKSPAAVVRVGRRVRKFLAMPAWQKYLTIARRARRWFPEMLIPLRLPFGAWWLLENDSAGAGLLEGCFEKSERDFVERYLRPGMVVLDIGAHKGLYSLISSERVGRLGRVFAIEPSPREQKRLKQHLRLNRCRNVRVFDCALGESKGTADLFLVQGTETGCNSLRCPDVAQPVTTVRVRVETLDDLLRAQDVAGIDFVKMDVEGAELSVLKGASRLLRSAQRPVILAEVQDIRTRPWGYRAQEIVRYLHGFDYSWFGLLRDGHLREIDVSQEEYDGNFVAIPAERVASIQDLISERQNVRVSEWRELA